jgi:signal transduction histidine kinase
MADAIEADREKERRLTADVAHELRTPLQAVRVTGDEDVVGEVR